MAQKNEEILTPVDKNSVIKRNKSKEIMDSASISRLVKMNKGQAAIISTLTAAHAAWFAKLRNPLHPDPDRSLLKENYYRMLRSCPAYSRAVSKLLPKLAGLSYHLERSKGTHPDLVYLYEQVFDNIKNFSEARARFAMTRLEGRTWLVMVKQVREFVLPSSGKRIRLIVPVELKHEMKELYEIQTLPLDSNTAIVQWTYGNIISGQREVLTPQDEYNRITVSYLPEMRNEYQGEALNSYIIPLVEAIQVLVNYALIHAEDKAETKVAIKTQFADFLDPALQAFLAAGSDASVQRITNFVEFYMKSKKSGAFILGPNDEVNAIDTAGRSQDIYRALLDLFDKWLEQAITVVLGGDGQDEGSYAKAESGRQEQNDVLAWYQMLLVEEPCQQIIKKVAYDCLYALDEEGNPLMDANGEQVELLNNYHQLYNAGLTESKLPKFKMGEVGKEEPMDNLPIFQFMFSVPKAKIFSEELYEKMGITRPPGTPEILETPDMQAGGMMPPAMPGGENADMGGMNPADMGGAMMSEQPDFLAEQIADEIFSDKPYRPAMFEELFAEPTEKKKTFKQLSEQAQEILLNVILTKIHTKAKSKNNKKLNDNLKQALKYVSVLFGIEGAKQLEKQLQNKDVKPVVEFAEAYFADKITPKSKVLNAKIQKRIEQDWQYGELDTEIASFDLVFQEALEALMEADPFIANTAEEISQRYLEGFVTGQTVFSALYADTSKKVDEIQAKMQDFLKTGKVAESKQEIQRILESTTAYANNVFRTNASTAYSVGRQIQEKPLVDSGYIIGYELLTAGDGRVRGRKDGVYDYNAKGENHWALHGTRMRANNPRWNGLTPPLSYQCRCFRLPITKYRAEQEGWLDKDGELKEFYPPSFSQAKTNKDFGNLYNTE